MDELFAEAVERLKAGESTASIVASYPADVQPELSELLAIVEMADQPRCNRCQRGARGTLPGACPVLAASRRLRARWKRRSARRP